jgi:hypothetical protein
MTQMTNGEQLSLGGEVFNPEACRLQTLDTFEASLRVSLGDPDGPLDIERRYLAADVYAVPARDGERKHIRQVDAIVAQRIADWRESRAAQMGEDLADIRAWNEGAQVRFRQTLASRAAELETVRQVPAQDLTQHVTMPSWVAGVPNPIDYIERGLVVASDRRGDYPVLLRVEEGDQPDRRILLVDLDALYVRDPEFVREQIIAYHADAVLAVLSGLIDSHQLAHAAPPELVVPSFVAAAAHEPTLADMQYVMDQGLTSLRWLISLPGSYVGQGAGRGFDDIKQRLRRFSPEGIFPLEWARHLRDCGAESDRVRDMAHGVIWASAVSEAVEPVFLRSLSARDARLLGNPTGNVRGRTLAQEGVSDLETMAAEGEAGAAIFESVDRASTVAEGNELLERYALQALRRTEELQQVLEDNHRFTSLDGIIDDVVRHIIVDTASRREEWSVEHLMHEIGRSLALVVQMQDAEALGLDLDTTRLPYLHFETDRQLAVALPLRAVMRAKERLAELRQGGNRNLEAVTAQVDHLVDGLAAKYQGMANAARSRMEWLARNQLEVDEFLQDSGIARADLEVLEGVMQDDNGDEYLDAPLYDTLFQLLYLAKRGTIDLRQPVHQLVLEELFHHQPQTLRSLHRVWPAFRSLVPPPTE